MFKSNPNTKSALDHTGELILQESLIFVSAFFAVTFVVPKDTRTDGASIPWFLQWFIPKNGKHDLASYLHDGGYRRRLYIQNDSGLIHVSKIMGKTNIDILYGEALLCTGVTKSRSICMAVGVYLFGWYAYLKSWYKLNKGKSL